MVYQIAKQLLRLGWKQMGGAARVHVPRKAQSGCAAQAKEAREERPGPDGDRNENAQASR